MNGMHRERRFARHHLYLSVVLGLAAITSLGMAQESGEVTSESAARLGEAAASAAFGAVELVGVTSYLDPGMTVSAYAIEYTQLQDGSAVTVIASARRDDVPIIMMWRGLPKHSDPDVLAGAAKRIEEALGVTVSEPTGIFWLDTYEVWARFPEVNPQTSNPILCNLYSGRIATFAELQTKWQNRQKNVVVEAQPAGISIASEAQERPAARTREQAAYIEGQWAAAEDFLANGTDRGSGLSIQALPRPTQYIAGVPNLNEQIPWDGQDWDGDSQIVAAMDVLLFWDTRGYDRLVDDGDLDAVHGSLREAMLWDRGSTDPNTASGLTEFISGPSYNNQYGVLVELLDMWTSPYPWPSFADCRREIDSGRPVLFGVRNYTDDPVNPSDFEYRDHMMCAVGYFEGFPFGGATSTEWVVVHDNWGGGNATDPYRIDDEPFVDWNRATDSLIKVQPSPSGTAVTYPSASGIAWRCGESQVITWNGFAGSEVKIELYKGSSLHRTIASSTANDGTHSWTVPGTQTTGSDFRIRITSISSSWQSDYSDSYFAITDVPQVVYPTGPRITWDRGSSYEIAWSGFAGSSVKIELCRGLTVTRTVASSAGNTGSYVWPVPGDQAIGSDYRIKITSSPDGLQFDYSDNEFTIADVPRVTYPTAPGVVWGRGIAYAITWDGFTGPDVAIELYKGTRLYSTIARSAPNTGSFPWTAPGDTALGSDFRIKITSASDLSQYDVSDNTFEIKDVAMVTYPTAAGITFRPGQSPTITWAGFNGSSIKIDLYKGASLHRTITSFTENDGSYTWPISTSQTLGSDFKIRVTSSDLTQFDESDNFFAIADPRVTYPTDAGIAWKVGESRRITWTGFIGAEVRIELYDGRTLNRTIAASTVNDGSYDWTIPGDQTPGTNFMIRIILTSDASQSDDSDNYFAITNPRVTYPTDAGLTWKIGESRTITWAGFNGSSVAIELYQGSSLSRTIAASTSNDGSYPWTVPAGQTLGSDFKIRITSTSDRSQTDESDNFFTIADPRVLYPTDPGITWRVGDGLTFAWSGFAGSSVRIELYNGSTLDRTIASSTANTGSYRWMVPADQTPGSDFRIRITSTSDALQSDESDNTVTIINPRVTYPTDAGVVWSRGGAYTITWDGFIDRSVTIELYSGGVLDRTIAPLADNTGSYPWTVPVDQRLGTDFRIRVTAASDRAQSDESDNPFAIDEVICPPRPVALWRFEPGAFTDDSIVRNNLTNDGAATETTDRKEGAACANLKVAERDSLTIYDDYLSTNFPTRKGDPNVVMTLCFWMKPRSFPYNATPISKYQIATDARSWRLFLGSAPNTYLKLAVGKGTGDEYTEYTFNQATEKLVANHWYHVAFTYRNSDKRYHVRVWDDTDRVIRIDREGTTPAAMAVTNAPIVLGNTPLESSYFDGLLDEVAVFNTILASPQIDKIRRGECRLYPTSP